MLNKYLGRYEAHHPGWLAVDGLRGGWPWVKAAKADSGIEVTACKSPEPLLFATFVKVRSNLMLLQFFGTKTS
jgi:hypothetical protein